MVRRAGQHTLALLAYLAAAFAYLAPPVLDHPSRELIGLGNDPEIFVWSLGWWPHALTHGVAAFATTAIWAPSGVNLAWATSVPVPSLVLWPITAAFGPVVAWNVVEVAAPALGGFCAYLLCRRICGRFWPALLGGYVYGYSSYELGQLLGHLHVSLTAIVPLVALVVVRALEGELRPRGVAIRIAVLLALQLGCSIELALSLTIALAVALALAWWQLPDRRAAVRALLRPLLVGYALAGVLAAPLIYHLLAGFETGAINSPFLFSADAVNLLLPTPLSYLSTLHHVPLVWRIRGNLAEDGAFVGPALLAVCALYAWRAWRRPTGRLLSLYVGVSLLAALGPVLRVAGVPVAPLPWLAVVWLPPFNNVLPVRLMLFASLAMSVVVSLWLARGQWPTWARWLLGVVAVLSLVPDVGSPIWHSTPNQPAFFQHDAWRRYLPPGSRLLIIPYANRGHSMLWQAQAGYGFDQTGGYVRPEPPPEFADDPFVIALDQGAPAPSSAADLKRFIAERGVTAIVLDESAGEPWTGLLATLGVAPVHVGGITLYRLPGRPGVTH